MLGWKLSIVWTFMVIAHLSLGLQQPLYILWIH